MLKSFLQNATVQRVLRSLLYGVLMAVFACTVVTINYPSATLGNYLATGTIIGTFGFVSYLYWPAAALITIIIGTNFVWGAINGIPVDWSGALVLLPSSGIPVLLALWRFLRPQQDSLSA